MRLSQAQIKAIKSAAAEIFGDEAEVWLFGSRADDSRRGGDVDLMVETAETLNDPAVWPRDCRPGYRAACTSRHVDVVVHAPGSPEQPIHRAARTHGVRL